MTTQKIHQKYRKWDLELGYCMAYDAVKTVIPGCSNRQQLINNVASTNFKLNTEVIKQIEELYDEIIQPMDLPW